MLTRWIARTGTASGQKVSTTWARRSHTLTLSPSGAPGADEAFKSTPTPTPLFCCQVITLSLPPQWSRKHSRSYPMATCAPRTTRTRRTIRNRGLAVAVAVPGRVCRAASAADGQGLRQSRRSRPRTCSTCFSAEGAGSAAEDSEAGQVSVRATGISRAEGLMTA